MTGRGRVSARLRAISFGVDVVRRGIRPVGDRVGAHDGLPLGPFAVGDADRKPVSRVSGPRRDTAQEFDPSRSNFIRAPAVEAEATASERRGDVDRGDPMPAGSPRWSRAGQDRATPRSQPAATYARSFHARLSRWSQVRIRTDAAAILVAASGIAGYVAVTVVRCLGVPGALVLWLRRSSCCDRNTYCDVAREALLLSTGETHGRQYPQDVRTHWGSTRVIARWSGDGPQCTQSAAGRSGTSRDPATVARSRSLQGDDPPPGGPAVACPSCRAFTRWAWINQRHADVDRCLAVGDA